MGIHSQSHQHELRCGLSDSSPIKSLNKIWKGENNPADYMIRHPAKRTTLNTRQEKVAEEYVDYLVKVSTPNAFKLHDIALATECDPTLQAVMEAMQSSN